MRRRTIALIWTAAPVAAILVWLAAGARSTTRIVERPVRGSKVAPAPTNGVPAAAVGPAVADEQRPSWMLHGGPRHLGRSSYAGPGAPHVIWSYSTGGRISTQPVVDRLGNVYFGAHDSFFYSLAPNGSLRWRLPAGDRIYSTAAIGADGTIYFGSDADRFFAVRPDGSLRFSLRTESDADTSPVIAPNGSLYFAAGTDLYAVSPGGAVRWRLRAGGKIFSSPALGADGTLYFGCQDDQLYAVQPDGKVLLVFPGEGETPGDLVRNNPDGSRDVAFVPALPEGDHPTSSTPSANPAGTPASPDHVELEA